MGESTRNWTNVLKNLEKRIIGGETTTKNLYPYYVQIFNYGGLCGGTILTSKAVLTAAHCFDHNKNLAEMQIFASMYVGILNLGFWCEIVKTYLNNFYLI